LRISIDNANKTTATTVFSCKSESSLDAIDDNSIQCHNAYDQPQKIPSPCQTRHRNTQTQNFDGDAAFSVRSSFCDKHKPETQYASQSILHRLFYASSNDTNPKTVSFSPHTFAFPLPLGFSFTSCPESPAASETAAALSTSTKSLKHRKNHDLTAIT
jgi:hypothetical protein